MDEHICDVIVGRHYDNLTLTSFISDLYIEINHKKTLLSRAIKQIQIRSPLIIGLYKNKTKIGNVTIEKILGKLVIFSVIDSIPIKFGSLLTILKTSDPEKFTRESF